MATIYTYPVQYQGVQYITARSTSVHNCTQVFSSLCTGLVLDIVGNYYIYTNILSGCHVFLFYGIPDDFILKNFFLFDFAY